MLSTNCDKLYVLADCNNFYASCETVFRPDLIGKALVVLSNNDGCIVSRSKKAKELGIPMGLPIYKQMDFLKKHNVHIFSSNYPLYGDISQRVMSVFESVCQEVEQYSIDEAFLTFPAAMAQNAQEVAEEIRHRVQKWIGITVSLGVAPTKTLAKVANHIAKKKESGIEIFHHNQDINPILSNFPIREVWGIGRKSALKCRANNIHSAYDLKNADDLWIRKNLSVSGFQTALELRGQPCFSADDLPSARKSVLFSRSFGQRITTQEALQEALCSFAANAAVKLRKAKLYASRMSVFAGVSKERAQYFNNASAEVHFPLPTNNTAEFIKAIPPIISHIYQKNTAYVRAGVMFYDLHPTSDIQLSLFHTPQPTNEELLTALDTINYRYGRHTIAYGAEGPKLPSWKGKQTRCSPQFTTKWDELKEVK